MKIYICSIEGLSDAASYDAASLKICSHRREKLSKIKGDADRRRSLCAGLLLNFAVKEYFCAKSTECEERECSIQELINTDKQKYDYKQDENGKPYIADIPGFHFSISHSGEYVLCACDDVQIGADLQWMDREVKDTLAQKVMTVNEYVTYMELPSQDKQKEFYRVWAIKESFCKLTGKGLSQDFREIDVENINCDAKLFKENYWLAVSRYE